jgi:hypothetical protein
MHKKKMIAPIVITALLVLYFIGFTYACVVMPGIPLLIKIVGGGIPLLIAGACIYVLIQRIKEIKNGVEDDLDKF